MFKYNHTRYRPGVDKDCSPMNVRNNKPLVFPLLIFILAALAQSCLSNITAIPPKQESWGLDLSTVDFSGNTIVTLEGDWEFYPNVFLNPSEFSLENPPEPIQIKVPGNWNRKFNNQGQGYGTYRMVLQFGETSSRLGILLKPVRTAYKIFLNGLEFHGAGVTGTTLDTSFPEYNSRLYKIPHSRRGSVEIIIHMSNFHHREGGITSPIQVARYEALDQFGLANLLKDLLLISVFAVLALYHLFLLLLSKKIKVHLPMLIISIAFSIWTMANSDFLKLYFPVTQTFERALKMEYFAIIIAAVGFFFLARGLSVYQNNKLIDTILLTVNGFYFLLVLFTPAEIYTQVLPVFLLAVILEVIYSVIILITIIHKNDKYLTLLVPGLCALMFGVLYDSFNLITGNPDQHLSSIAVFIFFLFLSLYLAKKIHPVPPNLFVPPREKLIAKEDMAVLQQMEHEYVDNLTGLWNQKGIEEMACPHIKKAKWWRKKITVVVIKLKGGDSISSLYGEEVLDEAYILVSKVMKENFRGPDLLARLDDDIFISLLEIGTKIDADAVYYRLQQVQSTINRTYSLPYAFKLSIQIKHLSPGKGDTIETFLNLLEIEKKIT